MKNFDNLDDFKKWAEKNKLNYQIEYESNNDIENGKKFVSLIKIMTL